MALPLAMVSQVKRHLTFSVVRYGQYFRIRHNATGQEMFVGNGINVIFDAATNQPVSPNDEHFIEMWENDLNEHAGEIWEDFFS
jgi:hypothetical protein